MNKINLIWILALVLFITGCDQQNIQINGNVLTFEDNNIFFEVTPHTLTQSGWVEVEFESKNYQGNIDFVVGFDRDTVKPSSVQYYNPVTESVQISYTCNGEFNYSAEDKWFTCYESAGGEFSHYYESGNIQEKTAYWNINKTIEWHSWNPTDKIINVDYADMNIWYLSKNQPIEKNKLYRMRYYLDIPFKLGEHGKYAIALKPSSETIQQAISNDHLYILDPWWSSSYEYKYNLNTTITGHKTEYNDTILDINVSTFNGSLDSLVVVYNNESTIAWAWTLHDKTDGSLVNDSISIILSNFSITNNTLFDNFSIYTPSTFSAQNNQTLFYMAETFEDNDINNWEINGIDLAVAPSTELNGEYIAVWKGGASGIGSNASYRLRDTCLDDQKVYAGWLTYRNDSFSADRHVVTLNQGNPVTSVFITIGTIGADNFYSNYNGVAYINIYTADPQEAFFTNLNGMDLTNDADVPFTMSVNYTNYTATDSRGSIDSFCYLQLSTTDITNNAIFIDDIYVSNYPFNLYKMDYTFDIQEQRFSPAVSFVTPTLNNGVNVSQSYIQINTTATFPNDPEQNITFFLYNTTDYLLDYQSYIDSTREHNFTSLDDNVYLYNVSVCDTGGICSQTETRSITLDTTDPILTLISGDGATAYYGLPANITFNYTATDTNLQTCYYNTSDNSALNITSCNSAYDIQFATTGNKTINYYANDSAGNLAYGIAYNYIMSYIYNQTVEPISAFEGYESEINLCINLSAPFEIPDTTAYLTWNNTNYGQGIRKLKGNDTYCFQNLFTIPIDAGGTGTNIVYWNWTFNISGVATNQITNLSNQTIFNFGVDDCSNYSTQIINYTIYNEESKTLLIPPTPNTTIENYVSIISKSNSSVVFNYSGNHSNSNSVGICISNSTSLLNHRLDAITLYTADGYVVEYHYFDNFNLTNTTTYPQMIGLYDLDEDDSTSFLITFEDDLFLPVKEAIIEIHRFYVSDGIYLSVEMAKTNDAGQTRAHLVTEDVKYKFFVRKNNELLYISPEYLAICLQSPCQINLNQGEAIENFTKDFTKVDNLVYNLDMDKDNRKVTLDYITNDGSSVNMNLWVVRETPYLNETICNSSQISSGGTITCTVPETYKNTTYRAEVRKDSEFLIWKSFNLIPNATEFFGTTGIILTILLYLTLVLIMAESPTATVIGSLLGVIFAVMLNLFTLGSLFAGATTIMWGIIAGALLIHKFSEKRL